MRATGKYVRDSKTIIVNFPDQWGTVEIEDAAITNAKIADCAVDKLTAGTITSQAITLAITATAGDVKIQAGKTDFGQATAGFILGIDDSDSDKAKFEIGNGASFLKWDGTSCTISIDSGSALTVTAAAAGTGITLEAGADIQFTPSDTDPSLIKWSTTYNMGAAATSARGLASWPTTINTGVFSVGYSPITNQFHPFGKVQLLGQTSAVIEAMYDPLDEMSWVNSVAGDGSAYVDLYTNIDAPTGPGVCRIRMDGTTTEAFYPQTGAISLGYSSKPWYQGWFSGTLTVAGTTEGVQASIFNAHATAGSGLYIKAGDSSSEYILRLDDKDATQRFVFFSDGTTAGLCPQIAIENPTPDDYLNWALEDAEKSYRQYEGAWDSEEAIACGITSERDEIDKHGRDYIKMSMGVTLWAKKARQKIIDLENRLELLER